eukprot:2660501-Prymnesium_polylepis.2
MDGSNRARTVIARTRGAGRESACHAAYGAIARTRRAAPSRARRRLARCSLSGGEGACAASVRTVSSRSSEPSPCASGR